MGSPTCPLGRFRACSALCRRGRGQLGASRPCPCIPSRRGKHGPSSRTRAQAMTTSLTLAAVAPTVCTGPLPASTPLWALWPECQLRPFRAWRASGSLPPFAFLAELGASANAASAIEPPPADLQGRGGVGNLVAEPEGHAREFKEGSGAADRVSHPFAREVEPRLQEAHAQQGMDVPVWRRSPPPPRSAVRLREASGHLRGRFGAPWNASLPIWRYRRSGRLLQPASPRFATACGAGSERRQSAVPQARAMPCWRACGPARWGRRSSYGNGFAIFSRYVTEPRDLPSESSRPMPDIRLFALI